MSFDLLKPLPFKAMAKVVEHDGLDWYSELPYGGKKGVLIR